MKKFALITLMGSFWMACPAQKIKEADVPAAVKNAFATTFPNMKVSDWEKENGNYEAEFKNKGTETSVLIDETGNILETEVEIPVTDLPGTALAYLNENYKGRKITEAAKITAADGMVSYEAEVSGKDLLFDSAGKFVRAAHEENADDRR